MRREALQIENLWERDAWTDEVDFALLEREWRQLRTSSGASATL